MDTIYRGDITTARGRLLAWVDALFVDHAVFRLAVEQSRRQWRRAGSIAATTPPPRRLAALTRRLGLKTLINLRGPTGNGSDALSREAAAWLGLDFIDMALESRGAPQRDRILRLHGIYRIDARAGAAALQVRRRPGRARRRAVRAVRGRHRPRRAAPVVAPLRPYPAGARPASSTRSSCAGNARARAESPSSTGCARTTMRPPCGGISTPTASPASSTTGCWRTNDRGRGAGDAADHRLARPVRAGAAAPRGRCAGIRPGAGAARAALRRGGGRATVPRCRGVWAASRKNISLDPDRGRSATAPCRRPTPSALAGMMQRFAACATRLVTGLLPGYAATLAARPHQLPPRRDRRPRLFAAARRPAAACRCLPDAADGRAPHPAAVQQRRAGRRTARVAGRRAIPRLRPRVPPPGQAAAARAAPGRCNCSG